MLPISIRVDRPSSPFSICTKITPSPCYARNARNPLRSTSHRQAITIITYCRSYNSDALASARLAMAPLP